MKLAWIVFASVMVLLLAYGLWNKENIRHEEVASVHPQHYSGSSSNGGNISLKKEPFFSRVFGDQKNPTRLTMPKSLLADSIVKYGVSLIGIPYLPAGITCEGFDCSGFVYHVYQKYGIELPHSSALLMKEGTEVPITEARKGDLIVFTGTQENNLTPGHVGVVITEAGEPIAFVHASSSTRSGGVKISKVDSTGYERRFLQVRRVL
ncbi:MAG: NlpC/P60 family protein [Adhaeribacter sp.]|nr:NlpC/P60 family protein [Adhaeribacter sp.]